MNNIVNAFDNNNSFSKFIIAALLFHQVTNLMIQDNRIIEYVVKLYLENKIYLLDYFPLFLAYPGNHDLTSILINLLMIDTTNGKDSDCYHIFCNYMIICY